MQVWYNGLQSNVTASRECFCFVFEMSRVQLWSQRLDVLRFLVVFFTQATRKTNETKICRNVTCINITLCEIISYKHGVRHFAHGWFWTALQSFSSDKKVVAVCQQLTNPLKRNDLHVPILTRATKQLHKPAVHVLIMIGMFKQCDVFTWRSSMNRATKLQTTHNGFRELTAPRPNHEWE